MSDVRLKLSPPWITYVKQLEVLFDPDPLIAFNEDYTSEEGPSVILATTEANKAAALRKLLPEEKKFGNVALKIDIDCPTVSNICFPTPVKLFEAAFKKNPVFKYAIAPADAGYYWFSMTYVVFKKEVVQYFNDNLNDAHGLVSTLYQDIAREIFADAGLDGVYYNTDIVDECANSLLGANVASARAGGWVVNVETEDFPEAVDDAFEQLEDLVGATYEPIAVIGTQIVSGVNYAVLAKQTILAGKDIDNIVMIIVNDPAGKGEASVVSIKQVIQGGDYFGGFNVNVEIGDGINKTAQRLFENRFGGFVGAVTNPIALLGSQIVRGTEYTFLCTTDPVLSDNDVNNTKVALVRINDLDDNVSFTDLLVNENIGYEFKQGTLGRPLGEWP